MVLCANIGGKAYVAVGISDTVVAAKNLDASKIIKEIAGPLISGGGGGQKNLATAGRTRTRQTERSNRESKSPALILINSLKTAFTRYSE